MEKIFIDFYDPEAKKVLDSDPHKIELYDTYLEFFARHRVISQDEHGEDDREWKINARATIMKSDIACIELYWNNQFNVTAIDVSSIANNEMCLFFPDKKKATEVYLKLQKWRVK